MRWQRRRGTGKEKAMWCPSSPAVSKCALSVLSFLFCFFLPAFFCHFLSFSHVCSTARLIEPWRFQSELLLQVSRKVSDSETRFKPRDLKDFWLKSEYNLTSYLTYVLAKCWCGYSIHFPTVQLCFGHLVSLKICLSWCTFVSLPSCFVTFLQYRIMTSQHTLVFGCVLMKYSRFFIRIVIWGINRCPVWLRVLCLQCGWMLVRITEEVDNLKSVPLHLTATLNCLGLYCCICHRKIHKIIQDLKLTTWISTSSTSPACLPINILCLTATLQKFKILPSIFLLLIHLWYA